MSYYTPFFAVPDCWNYHPGDTGFIAEIHGDYGFIAPNRGAVADEYVVFDVNSINHLGFPIRGLGYHFEKGDQVHFNVYDTCPGSEYDRFAVNVWPGSTCKPSVELYSAWYDGKTPFVCNADTSEKLLKGQTGFIVKNCGEYGFIAPRKLADPEEYIVYTADCTHLEWGEDVDLDTFAEEGECVHFECYPTTEASLFYPYIASNVWNSNVNNGDDYDSYEEDDDDDSYEEDDDDDGDIYYSDGYDDYRL